MRLVVLVPLYGSSGIRMPGESKQRPFVKKKMVYSQKQVQMVLFSVKFVQTVERMCEVSGISELVQHIPSPPPP